MGYGAKLSFSYRYCFCLKNHVFSQYSYFLYLFQISEKSNRELMPLFSSLSMPMYGVFRILRNAMTILVATCKVPLSYGETVTCSLFKAGCSKFWIIHRRRVIVKKTPQVVLRCHMSLLGSF